MSRTALSFVDAVEARFLPLANPERARAMEDYLRDQFGFLGLPAPVRREAIRDLLSVQPAEVGELIATAVTLWDKPEREYRYTAIDLLTRHLRLLTPAHLPFLQDLITRDSWWDTVDGLAALISRVVRAARQQDPLVQGHFDDWIEHPVFWVRRVAMIHQLGWRLDTDRERLEGYALRLGAEKEFFIRKAIGWALRDYARWDPLFVKALIERHRAGLSSLTIREAGKHLGS